MMRVLACAFAVLFPFLSQAQCTELTASGNAEYPPYLWRPMVAPERLDGAVALLMRDIAQLVGVNIRMVYAGPWGRTQEEVAAGNVDLIAGAFYTQARTLRMDYLQPAFQLTRSVIWVRKEATFTFQTLPDLVGKRGVTVINNSFGQTFDDYARTHLQIVQVGSLDQALRMLSNGRVDYLVYEEEPGRAYIERAAIGNLQMLEPQVSSEALYLTLSLKSPCNTAEFKARLEQALRTVTADQRMEAYLRQASEAWRKDSHTAAFSQRPTSGQ